MARYQIILAYDGTEFLGFQRQGKGGRTVQLEVEDALRQLNWQGKSILSAGRTDCGVHAAGQVIAFDLDWKHSPQELGQALNAKLPADIAVQEVLPVQDDFHPRYDAVKRLYRYEIYCGQYRNPLRDRFCWQVLPEPNLLVMNEAACELIGIHDFAAFGTPPRTGGSTIRCVYQANWSQAEENCYQFFIAANAFLYHMVRRSVYLLVKIGQGRLKLSELLEAVNEQKKLNPGIAPAHGLSLQKVWYAENKQANFGNES
jgi:tRNA pseudouridine38-40 synthase